MKIYKPEEINGVNPFYLNRFKHKKGFEHIGYLAVKDKEYYSYFSCESDKERLVPILGFYGCSTNIFEEDFSFTSEYNKYNEENLNKLVREKPYVLFFVGCDDGSTGLRFKDKIEADMFLNRNDITCFDDIYDFLEFYN